MYVLHAFVCVCVIRQHMWFTHAMVVHTRHTQSGTMCTASTWLLSRSLPWLSPWWMWLTPKPLCPVPTSLWYVCAAKAELLSLRTVASTRLTSSLPCLVCHSSCAT